jgi:hypothetical protein
MILKDIPHKLSKIYLPYFVIRTTYQVLSLKTAEKFGECLDLECFVVLFCTNGTLQAASVCITLKDTLQLPLGAMVDTLHVPIQLEPTNISKKSVGKGFPAHKV